MNSKIPIENSMDRENKNKSINKRIIKLIINNNLNLTEFQFKSFNFTIGRKEKKVIQFMMKVDKKADKIQIQIINK
jgi:hypothetical protein